MSCFALTPKSYCALRSGLIRCRRPVFSQSRCQSPRSQPAQPRRDKSGRRRFRSILASSRRSPMQRVRWDLYLVILRAIAMFIRAGHELYSLSCRWCRCCSAILRSGPSAIGAVFGDPSRLWEYDPGDPTSNGDYPDVSRGASFTRIHSGQWWWSFECFLETSDRHKPSKLIKNQNASTINADKLKAKMSETIISSAPPAFSSEYFGDELGSLSSCRSK